MRLCFLCEEYPPSINGGIGRVVQTTARALVSAGHQVRVAGLYSNGDACPDYEEDRGVQVYRLREKVSRSFRVGFARSRYSLYRLVSRWAKAGEIELVEVPDAYGQAAYWPRLPVPLVCRLHGSYSVLNSIYDIPPEPFELSLEKKSLRRCDFVSSISEFITQPTAAVLGSWTAPTIVLHNMSPVPDAMNTSPRSRNRVLFNGTLTTRKGVLQLLDAWRIVQLEIPEAELQVYGKDTRSFQGGSMRRHLEEVAGGIPNGRISFFGHVERSQLDEALRTTAVSVFPSLAEGFGLAPVDSMSMGCPTIFSDRCAGREIIQHGKDGLLVDPENPKDIAGAIVRFLREPIFANSCALEGWKKCLRLFSVEALLPRYIDYYQSCIQAHDRAGN